MQRVRDGCGGRERARLSAKNLKYSDGGLYYW